MAASSTPTKGNLINAKKSLELSTLGYELLDKKRNILIRELMSLIDKAKSIQGKIDAAYEAAYLALETANITMGFCDEISRSVPEEDSLTLSYRSVMGVEIPIVAIKEKDGLDLDYGLYTTNSILDAARQRFEEVKVLTAQLAEIENSVYRLATAISTTQRRANALKNIMIPRFEDTVKYITDALDEKDREEFSRLKVIKRQKLEAEQEEQN